MTDGPTWADILALEASIEEANKHWRIVYYDNGTWGYERIPEPPAP